MADTGESTRRLTQVSRLKAIVAAYEKLLARLAPHCECIQIEEPVLCTELLPKEAARQFTQA